MILLSIKFVLLTMLKFREEQIHFWFCWCFPPTGPMHLISALSLWAGTLRAKTGRSFTTPRFHQVKDLDLRAQTHWGGCCQRRTSNCWANEEHGWHCIKRCRCQSPHLNQKTQLKNEHGEKYCSLNPHRKVKSVVIHIYPFYILFSLKLFTFHK